jgi:hypothetical protein
MKNSAQVLSHIVHQPQYKKLTQHQCINAIKALLPPHLQTMVSFAYVKHKVLYFVLTHPGAKQEFDIIIASIKTPLKQYPPQKCQEMDFDDIRAYVSHKPLTKMTEVKKETVPLYEERASGNFENSVKDERLHNIIEKIRASIHDRQD